MRKIFITNDDGINAPGLSALEQAVSKRGFSFFTSAPLSEQSGCGHSITLLRPLRVKKFAENRFAVDGTPTDSVFLGLHELFKDEKPLFALSGINRGGNLGNDFTYSGTVGAAMETYSNGITSFALSLFVTDFAALEEKYAFAYVADLFFDAILPEIKKKTGKDALYETPHFFNINVPDTIVGEPNPEICWTSLGERRYGGGVIKRVDPRRNDYYWIGGDQHSFLDIEGSDCNAVKSGCVSVTPIAVSFTDRQLLEHIGENHGK